MNEHNEQNVAQATQKPAAERGAQISTPSLVTLITQSFHHHHVLRLQRILTGGEIE